MNFFSFRTQESVAGSSLVREVGLFVDSRGEVFQTTQYAFPCAQGRHLVTGPGLCKGCEREFWRSEGWIGEPEGWVSGALKVVNEDREVLVAQGWTVRSVTAEFSYLEAPADAEEILLPIYEPSDMPEAVAERLTLVEAPELPAPEKKPLTRLSRKGLMAYKRVAPTLKSLAEHLGYLTNEALGPKRRVGAREE